MCKMLPLVAFLFALLSVPASVQGAETTLFNMRKEESPSQTRILLHFSDRPNYQVKVSGQRVDLIIRGASLGTGLEALPEDGTVIKTLLIGRRDELVVSLLLRRSPVGVDARYQKSKGELALELFWDKGGGGVRPAIIDQVGKVAQSRDKGISSRNRQASPYAGDWRRFFAEYETPFRFTFPAVYTLAESPPPELPAAGPDSQISDFLAKGRMLAERGEWKKVPNLLGGMLGDTLRGEERDFFLVILSESLARLGNLRQALDTLSPFLDNHPDSPYAVRARYLSAYLRASSGDPYGAQYDLAAALQKARADSGFLPALHLLQAEVLIAKEHYEKALSVLEGAELQGLLADQARLCRAIAFVGLGRHSEAIPLFEDMQVRYGALPLPLHVERFAHALYRSGRYAEAIDAYGSLARLIAGQPQESLAFYARALAQLRDGRADEAKTSMNRIQVAFGESEGGQRSLLKQIDLEVASGNEKALVWAIIDYGRLAGEFSHRGLREEAAFKQAASFHLNGDGLRCVEALKIFTRDFFSGRLRQEAEALLGQVLPGVITELIAAKEHLRALVFVEQNRDLLLNQRIGWDFLIRLADAFTDMELLDRAARIYFYLLDNNSERSREQGLYLPLVGLLFKHDRHELSVEYARRYAERFPGGKDAARLLLLEARSLLALGRAEEAAELLTADDRPAGEDLDLWGGRICERLERYPEVVRLLEKYRDEEVASSAEKLCLLAEGLYMDGRAQEALALFERLLGHADYGDRAAYRCAQIHLSAERPEQALKLLRSLSDKGTNPLWREMAGEMIALLEL